MSPPDKASEVSLPNVTEAWDPAAYWQARALTAEARFTRVRDSLVRWAIDGPHVLGDPAICRVCGRRGEEGRIYHAEGCPMAELAGHPTTPRKDT